jgi:ABC-2 type transport system ATP-binding protein
VQAASDLVIRTAGLTKTYSRRRALDGLDLEVPRGEVFGFLGPNGAGKTTAVLLLIGAIAPSGGRAEVLGKPAGDRPTRRRLGYLPEQFQFPAWASPRELYRYHADLLGLTGKEGARRAGMYAEVVGLGAVVDRPVRTFSKGMLQRVGLGQALLGEPELLLLDEPTSGLDPVGIRAVRDLILYLRGRGTTIFLNSHQLSEVELTCDRVAVLHRGKVVAAGRVGELLRPTHEVEIRAAGLDGATVDRLRSLALRLEGADGHWVAEVGRAEDIPELAAAVVSSGARLEALVPRRETLEEAFLRLVGGGEALEGEAPRAGVAPADGSAAPGGVIPS